MIYNFPILYLKKSSPSHSVPVKIKFWKIFIDYNDKIAKIFIEQGYQNGKIIKNYPDIIESLGKKSAYERAFILAKTKFENKLKKGYSEKLIDKINIQPMRPYNLDYTKVRYPAYLQPKIDGFRCLIHKNDGNVIYYTASKNKFHHIDFINKDFEKINIGNNIYLDGELYIPNESTRTLRSILSSNNLDQNKLDLINKVEIIIFDMFDINNLEMAFNERYNFLENIFKTKYKYLKLMPTHLINNEKQLDDYFSQYVKDGYEGIIIRNGEGKYKFNRSYDIMKSKNILKSRYIIKGYKEGQKAEKGTVIWEIKCGNRSFWAKPMGTREERAKLFKNAEKYIGKSIMIKYFEKDKDGCVTKNPVAYFE